MSARLSGFLEEACRAIASEVPELPTHMGLFEISGWRVPQDRFAGVDEASLDRRFAVLDSLAARLSRFSAAPLDADEQVSAGVLDFLLDYAYESGLVGRAGRDLVDHDYLLRPSVGIQSALPLFLADLHPMRDAEDAESYLDRLKNLAPTLDDAVRQVLARRRKGCLPPRMVLADTIDEVERLLQTDADSSIMAQAFREKTARMQGLDESKRQQLLTAASAEIRTSVYPAYANLLDQLKSLAPEAPAGPGLWCLPHGEEWYAFLLRSATTTPMGAEEIHQLGLEETARLKAELLQSCRELGLACDNLPSAIAALESSQRLPVEDTEDNRRRIVAEVERLMSSAERDLSSLFHRLPRTSVEVSAIPRFAEASRNQSYHPPSPDGSRAGAFELNVGQLLGTSRHGLSILVHHEIFPGHHLQLALALEAAEQPSLRRIITFDAYIEGWAKYAETIAESNGLTSDPRARLARMQRELISTANLALDTGIHVKRWSEGKAIEFCCEHTGCSPDFARYLVHRSASVPAQMCSYKIGMLKFQQLHSRFQAAFGDGFDIRDFHSAVLDCGAVPLQLLDGIVDRAIDRQQRPAG